MKMFAKVVSLVLCTAFILLSIGCFCISVKYSISYYKAYNFSPNKGSPLIKHYIYRFYNYSIYSVTLAGNIVFLCWFLIGNIKKENILNSTSNLTRYTYEEYKALREAKKAERQQKKKENLQKQLEEIEKAE